MKKQFIHLLFIIVTFHCCIGQINLVPNPGFENYTTCPTSIGQLYLSVGWDSNRESPDYFNICATATEAQVPKNAFGNQSPYNGNAYCGIITYLNTSLSREIIGIQLTSPLIISQKYYVSFKVNKADSNQIIGYSTNNIGFRFSTVNINPVNIDNFAHYSHNSVITDATGWTNIFTSFIADSAYTRLMIGNFFDDSNTNIINDGLGWWAYYYIDEVCVSVDSLECQSEMVNVKENHRSSLIKIFPNPASNFFSIHGAREDPFIYNSIGVPQNISFKRIDNEIIVDCSFWISGLYFIKIKNQLYKLIITQND